MSTNPTPLREAFFNAVQCGRSDVLAALLEQDPSLGMAFQSPSGGGDAQTALMMASSGDLASVEVLLPFSDARASTSEKRWTALMLAAASDQSAIVEKLIPHSDVNALSSQGESALNMAIVRGGPQCVQALARHTDLSRKGPNGETALMQATRRNEPQMLQVLLPLLSRRDCTARNNQGASALMIAIDFQFSETNRQRCVEMLVPYSDGSQRNENGYTAWETALFNRLQACADIVLMGLPEKAFLEAMDSNAFKENALDLTQTTARLTAMKEREALGVSLGKGNHGGAKEDASALEATTPTKSSPINACTKSGAEAKAESFVGSRKSMRL